MPEFRRECTLTLPGICVIFVIAAYTGGLAAFKTMNGCDAVSDRQNGREGIRMNFE